MLVHKMLESQNDAIVYEKILVNFLAIRNVSEAGNNYTVLKNILITSSQNTYQYKKIQNNSLF